MQNDSRNSSEPVNENELEYLSNRYYLALLFLLLVLSVNTLVLFQNASNFNGYTTQSFQKETMSQMNNNIYSVSKFDLNDYTLSYYDQGLNSIVKIQFSNNYTNIAGSNGVFLIDQSLNKYTSFDNLSLILDKSEFNYTTESVIAPKIYYLNFLETNNTYLIGKELNIGCTIPQLYVNQFADICVNNDIKLLSSTTLAIIQEYGNAINTQSGYQGFFTTLNPYGSSLILFNLQSNTIMSKFLLPDNGIYIYDYISPDMTNGSINPNNLWIHYSIQITNENEEGFFNVNVTSGQIQKKISTLTDISNYDAGFTTNNDNNLLIRYAPPIILNDNKLLAFYSTSLSSGSYYLIFNIQNHPVSNIPDIEFNILIDGTIFIGIFFQKDNFLIFLKESKNFIIHLKDKGA